MSETVPTLPVREDVTAAIDIGGTKIALGLVDDDGRLLAKDVIPTNPRGGFPAAMQRVTFMLSGLSRQAGCRPAGIGIGSTGPVDPISGIYSRPDLLPGWDAQPLTETLAHLTGLPARVENDADAHALGEAVFGAGKEADPFLMVTVGTGMGTALIREGQVYRGVAGSHPEMGHLVVEAGGDVCVCGARGCWEAYATGPAWEAWHGSVHPERAGWKGREICAAARDGDPTSLDAVRREGYYLGVGLSTLVNVLSPRVIAMAGGMMESFDLFEPHIWKEIRQRCVYMPVDQMRVVPAALGQNAGLLGAAQVWKKRKGSG